MDTTTGFLARFCFSSAVALCGVLVAGCDAEEPSDTESEAIAAVEFDNGTTIEFRTLPDGVTIVSEMAPEGSFSRLDYLLATYGSATPLEVFTALQPHETPPEELVVEHEELAESEGLELTPRRLQLPLKGARAGTAQIDFPANCNLSADGSWFDGVWQGAGFDWHWYRSTTKTGFTVSPSKNTQFMYGHACNKSVTNNNLGSVRLRHIPLRNGGEVGVAYDVPVGHRSLFWTTSPGVWGARTYKWPGAPGAFRMGVMAP